MHGQERMAANGSARHLESATQGTSSAARMGSCYATSATSLVIPAQQLAPTATPNRPLPAVRLVAMYMLRTSFAQSRVEERISECGSGEFATIAATANLCGPPLLYLTYLCSLQASSACRASGAAARLRKAARESVAPRLA